MTNNLFIKTTPFSLTYTVFFSLWFRNIWISDGFKVTSPVLMPLLKKTKEQVVFAPLVSIP
jgi:hypothetical protein